jgi:hypothetical protein
MVNLKLWRLECGPQLDVALCFQLEVVLCSAGDCNVVLSWRLLCGPQLGGCHVVLSWEVAMWSSVGRLQCGPKLKVAMWFLVEGCVVFK